MDNIQLDEIINNPLVRKSLAIKSHYWFFHIYFSHYVKYPTADFQREIFQITEDQSITEAVIVSFRGSAKSTIMTLSYPVWAMVGTLHRKCIVIASLTQNQSTTLLYQIKQELESNTLLKQDFGNFSDENFPWRSDSLVVGPYGTRIMAVSANESIRGIRHGSSRPDLIICDDVEDLNSVKTQEARDKTHKWFTGELIPMGDNDTKIVVIGNLLHDDSLIRKLQRQSEDDCAHRVVKSYPLVNQEGQIIWPGKYPDMEAVNRERDKIGFNSFEREYMLRIIPDEDAIVKPEWIHYYDTLPSIDCDSDFQYLVGSVDLAISDKSTADFTAIVFGYVFNQDDETKVYISPEVINRHISFPETIKQIIKINSKYQYQGITPKWFVEDAGYQISVVQELKQYDTNAIGVKLHGADKTARLSQTTNWIQSGKVLFPKKGAEVLVRQLLGFSTEKHDDLVDAFSMLVLQLIGSPRRRVRCFSKDSDAYRDLVGRRGSY